MADKKVGIITQAHMGSTRLPNKVMLTIAGKTLLEYHIERLQKSGLPIYVATSVNPADDPIVALCQSKGVSVYRGSEEDVLDRYYQCAKENSLDIIVRVTSDCPLVDGELIARGLAEYLTFGMENIHYSNSIQRTYPHGSNFEIFSFKLLEEAAHNATSSFDREHVTPYIIQNKSGHVVAKHCTRAGKDASGYRITVDYPADFELMKILIETYDAATKNMEDIIHIYEEHPELVEMNIPPKPMVWGTEGK